MTSDYSRNIIRIVNDDVIIQKLMKILKVKFQFN